MADNRRVRAALKGVETRLRRGKEHTRRAPRAVDGERVEAGGASLDEAFSGVPSAKNFISRAHLSEREGRAVRSAFIFHDPAAGLVGDAVTLLWYVCGRSQLLERARGPFVASSRTGETFRLTPTAPLGPSEARVGARVFKRTCTGFATFHVERIRRR